MTPGYFRTRYGRAFWNVQQRVVPYFSVEGVGEILKGGEVGFWREFDDEFVRQLNQN